MLVCLVLVYVHVVVEPTVTLAAGMVTSPAVSMLMGEPVGLLPPVTEQLPDTDHPDGNVSSIVTLVPALTTADTLCACCNGIGVKLHRRTGSDGCNTRGGLVAACAG